MSWWSIGTVQGHSQVLGQDKQFNDQVDAQAKQGALNAARWSFSHDSIPGNDGFSRPPTFCPVCASTRSQITHAPPKVPVVPANTPAALWCSDTDFVSLQSTDPALCPVVLHLSDPVSHTIPDSDLKSIPVLRDLYRMVKGLSVHVSEKLVCGAS